MERETETESPKIIVTGDVSFDIFVAPPSVFDDSGSTDAFRTPTSDVGVDCRFAIRRGGSLLLADFLQHVTEEYVFSEIPMDFKDTLTLGRIPQTIVHLCRFPQAAKVSNSRSTAVRVREQIRLAPLEYEERMLDKPRNFPANPDIVVICDEGRAYRNSPETWMDRSGWHKQPPTVVLLSRMPLAGAALWEFVTSGNRMASVAVVLVEDLRAQGAAIPPNLSWERTGFDVLEYVSHSDSILNLPENLIVLIGLEGALLVRRTAEWVSASLYYCPTFPEGATTDQYPGHMPGATSAFVASLTARILGNGQAGIEEGIRDGLRSAARLQRDGFRNTGIIPEYPVHAIFAADGRWDDQVTYAVGLPSDRSSNGSDLIVGSIGPSCLLNVARDVVIEGPAAALREIPAVTFGRCNSIDRGEYEQLRIIQHLVEHHLSRREARPLSLAVFAPVGSGKSFAIREVVASATPGRTTSFEFNVSQFLTPNDLACAFHAVREATLGGYLPILFLDEFDSEFDGRPLGWLKYFLAPMQDGMFQEGSQMRHIGAPVVVFLSGLHASFRDFDRSNISSSDVALLEFTRAKGPDFVSRLRGHVDLLGINRRSADDDTYVLRRALILRTLLQSVSPSVFDSQRRANIDPTLLDALLMIGNYKYGVRSLEQLLKTSLTNNATRFVPAMLPDRESLRVHVDPEEFAACMANHSFGT